MKAKQLTKETITSLGIQSINWPEFEVGDALALSLRIKEGNKERLQVFEGDVIAMHKNGASSTVTVRKIGANAIAVERIFPMYSPLIESVKFVSKGKCRRAKLFYMRERIGKAARVEEQVMTRGQRELREARNERNAARAQESKKDISE